MMHAARRSATAAAAFAALIATTTMADAQASIRPADWAAYRQSFVAPDGRVVDDGNGNISHSEGQGYGLLLATLADDMAAFDLIWSFTRTELLLRDDGLAVWKWDPAATPHVTDPNNATDGDILIAYALTLAGQQWQRPELLASSSTMATAIAELIGTSQGRTVIMPGAAGYGTDERPDGPVVNLSYWIYEAFPLLAEIAPATDWQAVSDDGIALLRQSLLGPRRLPPEWLSIKTRPRPAEGFPGEFGYNALRIPLYLIRAGVTDADLLRTLADGMSTETGGVAIVDIATGEVTTTLTDPGYAIIPALVGCVLDATPIPPALRVFEPTLYYPSTLHLLSLSFVTRAHPECLG
ncbi:glycosyl hydrolase family 8 [Aurantimonas sp. HBX-1]|uniref:glycosyl hydrolase family 8 n=1 Tax=Aurantimonas sp. HBX-1 TaxID=2906072 RepID=UPI001F3D1F73|nr:glycosyl hydrolase family 8 [Aurantimonas sp. HBX-1]UIJ73145.1 glycosyl hydrolase family 8 [Aurantimonas sp. HBX-1]